MRWMSNFTKMSGPPSWSRGGPVQEPPSLSHSGALSQAATPPFVSTESRHLKGQFAKKLLRVHQIWPGIMA